MLGFSLGIGGRGAKPSGFDPTTLPLNGFWRGSYSGSPLVGTASAGGSGSRDLTEATNPPATGTAVDGFVPARFITNDQLNNASTIATFVSASAYFWWALFYSEAAGGTDSLLTAYNNPCIWSDAGVASTAAFFYDNAGTQELYVGHYDGSYKANAHTITLNTWNLICVRFDGTNVRSRLNNGSVSVSPAVGNIAVMTGTLRVGANYNAAVFWNGRLEELAFMSTAETDARFDDIYSSVRARYPSARSW